MWQKTSKGQWPEKKKTLENFCLAKSVLHLGNTVELCPLVCCHKVNDILDRIKQGHLVWITKTDFGDPNDRVNDLVTLT